LACEGRDEQLMNAIFKKERQFGKKM